MKTNWKAKLKTVLTITAENEKYGKSIVTKGDKTQNDILLSLFVTTEKEQSSKLNQDFPKEQPFNLHKVLNRMIERGVRFDVGSDEFQIIDERQVLTEADFDFLAFNQTKIIAHFQQTLLMKFIFAGCRELFDDFAFEIREKEAFAIYNGEPEPSAYNLAVISTTRRWFEDTFLENNK